MNSPSRDHAHTATGATPDGAASNESRNAEIIQLRREGGKPREIARRLMVSLGVVSGVIWRHEHHHVRKGRADTQGVANGHARLTEQQVRDIRVRSAAREKGASLAAEYQVHPSLITLIIKRRRWAHVA